MSHRTEQIELFLCIGFSAAGRSPREAGRRRANCSPACTIIPQNSAPFACRILSHWRNCQVRGIPTIAWRLSRSTTLPKGSSTRIMGDDTALDTRRDWFISAEATRVDRIRLACQTRSSRVGREEIQTKWTQ